MDSSTVRWRAKVALCLWLICTPFAIGQQQPTQATTAEIKTLLNLNGSQDVAAQLGSVMAEQVIAALRRANPGLSPRADAVVSGVVQTYVHEQAARESVVDELVPIYAKYLTGRDIEQLIKFYRTPVGRKLASVTPGISLDSSRVGQQWAQSIAPGLETRLMEALKQKGLIQ